MKKIIWIGIALLLVFVSVSSFNGLVSMDEKVSSQWGNVETAYQRRADLIPNLVSTVKGYADFEKETLMGVIEARSKATQTQINVDDLSPENIQKFQAAQSKLSGSLSRLLVTVERYPDLKASQNFLELQSQLEGTENRIAVERNKFNKAVEPYNAKVRKFPTVIFANMFDFTAKGYFNATEGADVVPTVTF
ncbi:MAG: LemA protein [Candidatus Azotimanducaceae bacterium]|jgi:LemA protein